MAIIQSLRKVGVDAEFYNIDYFRYSKAEVEQYFLTNQFDLVGISAVVSTAYAYTKWLSQTIRRVSPETTILVGGNMAASAEILLRQCEVDFCIAGDGEYIVQDFVEGLRKFKASGNRQVFDHIKGVSFIDGTDKFRFTGFGRRPNADEIEYPDYSILQADGSLPYFIYDTLKVHSQASLRHKELSQMAVSKTALVTAAKGCVARCTFCHRWEKGYRARPIDGVIEHIRMLRDQHGVDNILIADENFGADRETTRELAAELGKLGITWQVAGVRARTVTESDLQLWADNNCMVAYFGIESGSEKILEIMEKHATVEENVNALRWTGQAGIATIIQLVIGMPGETDETISETIEFLKRVSGFMIDWKTKSPSELISINYAQALPGTPLYEFAREHGYIGASVQQEEAYLLRISDTDAYAEDHFINYTGLPLLQVLMWRQLILAEIDAFHAQTKNSVSKLGLLEVFSYYAGLLVVRGRRRVTRWFNAQPISAPVNPHATSANTHQTSQTDSGYFNIHSNLKFAPLLLNPVTKIFFYPALALAVAFWRGGSVWKAMRLLVEHVTWSLGLFRKKAPQLQKKSLRKVISLQKVVLDASADEMVPLRLGR